MAVQYGDWGLSVVHGDVEANRNVSVACAKYLKVIFNNDII